MYNINAWRPKLSLGLAGNIYVMEVYVSSVSLRLTATSMSAAELNLVCIPHDDCSHFSDHPPVEGHVVL